MTKKRVANAYDSGEDWVSFSKNLGIKYSSAFTIIRKWRINKTLTTGKRGGSKKIITSEIGDSLLNFIEMHNLVTLAQMKKFLQNSFHLSISVPTISRFLEFKCVTTKLIREVPANRNSIITKEKRYTYIKNMIDNGISFNQCVYIDESGFHLWIVVFLFSP